MSEVAKSIRFIQGFGLSAAWIGEFVGITPQHVNTIARNGADPKHSTATKILQLADAVRDLEKAAKSIKTKKS